MSGNFFTEFTPDTSLAATDSVEFYQPDSGNHSRGYGAGRLSPNYFDDDGWQLCSGPSLRGHIVNAHLQPHVLDGIGLPLYDVEVAKVRGVGLGWVVRKAMQRLELSDGELSDYIADAGVHKRMTPADYRLAVVKTISLISQHDMAQVPWSAVNRIYRGASEVTINAALECDMSFLDTHQGKQTLQEAEARRATLAQFGPIHKSGGLKAMLNAEWARDDFKVNLD